MVCSPAQLTANRQNALKSSGPRTSEGKERSRRNALKHGLTGDGIALPDEDNAAVQERFEAFDADLKPKGSVAQYLVLRAAMLSVRLERCVRHESAETTRDMLRAEQVEDDAQADEVARLAALIVDQPAEAVRRLRRTVEGIAWMIRAWEALKSDLLVRTFQRWSSTHRDRAGRLMGHQPEEFGVSRISALSHAIDGNFRLLTPGDWPDLPIPERKEAARVEMIARIEAEVARLELAREGLDHQAIARERAGAAARAIFGTSKEAILARKYEATAEREFYRALKEVKKLEASDQTEPEPESPDASLDTEGRSPKSGSFFQGRGEGSEARDPGPDPANLALRPTRSHIPSTSRVVPSPGPGVALE